jgi:hypothetical protein
MHKLFYVLSVAIVLLVSRGFSSTNTVGTSLSFYVVTDEKVDGGRFIDTPDFPKLGYIATKPDLVITQLVAVSETVSSAGMINSGKGGKQIETPLPDVPTLNIQILPEDAQKFETLTKDSIGKRVLLMLGDVPLIAPRVNEPISKQSFTLTMGNNRNHKMIEDELKKLVH